MKNHRWKKLAKWFIIFLTLLVVGIFSRYWWKEKRWRYIIVHHTASDLGNLEYYRRIHQQERGWDDIAYHFVINNGSFQTIPGQIEESNLWKERRRGYSTSNKWVNTFAIAIVIVGNLNNHPPLPQQYESLINLLVQLSKQYNIPPERIIGHREIQNTECPGKYLNMAKVRLDVKKKLNIKN